MWVRVSTWMAGNVGEEMAAIGVPLAEALGQPIWSVVDPEAAEKSVESGRDMAADQ